MKCQNKSTLKGNGSEKMSVEALLKKDSYTTEDLVEIMEILRGEGGCPWDREQTHKTIRNNFIEEVYEVIEGIDDGGFPASVEQELLTTYAEVKTLRGYTLIANNSDFDKAYINFTIRYSQTVYDAYYNSDNSNRDILINFRGKVYKIEYLNNIDFANVELEMQAKEVTH